MPTKTRIIIVSIIILLGVALFSYCAFFHPTEITSQAKGVSTTVNGPGLALVNETSTGGLERNKSGQINQTPSESRSRPKSGAT